MRGPSRPRAPQTRRGAVAVESAVIISLILVPMMFGIWEVGRMIEVQQLMVNAAREGARVASGGNVNGTSVTVSMVQDAVRDYLTEASKANSGYFNPGGVPAAVVSAAQITLTNTSGNGWTDPCDAQPLDTFNVTLTFPEGAAFNSMNWQVLKLVTNIKSMSVTVGWRSMKDSLVVVDPQLPY
jgi:Flp pilus assembly protein TadG